MSDCGGSLINFCSPIQPPLPSPLPDDIPDTSVLTTTHTCDNRNEVPNFRNCGNTLDLTLEALNSAVYCVLNALSVASSTGSCGILTAVNGSVRIRTLTALIQECLSCLPAEKICPGADNQVLTTVNGSVMWVDPASQLNLVLTNEAGSLATLIGNILNIPTSSGGTSTAGATGPIGPQGIPGINGTNGNNGNDGAIGVTGPQGIQGPKGDTGATGPQGIQGVPGTSSSGGSGSVGPQGPIGLTGPQGIPGTNGTNGNDGAIGATGPQGPAGTSGGTTSIDCAVILPLLASCPIDAPTYASPTKVLGLNSTNAPLYYKELQYYHFEGKLNGGTQTLDSNFNTLNNLIYPGSWESGLRGGSSNWYDSTTGKITIGRKGMYAINASAMIRGVMSVVSGGLYIGITVIRSAGTWQTVAYPAIAAVVRGTEVNIDSNADINRDWNLTAAFVTPLSVSDQVWVRVVCPNPSSGTLTSLVFMDGGISHFTIQQLAQGGLADE